MSGMLINAQVNRRRSAKGNNAGHENGEAMASVGARVEPTVRRHFFVVDHSATAEKTKALADQRRPSRKSIILWLFP